MDGKIPNNDQGQLPVVDFGSVMQPVRIGTGYKLFMMAYK